MINDNNTIRGYGPATASLPTSHLNPSDPSGFGALFEASIDPGARNSGPARLGEAARQMEVHLVTSMLETMDAATDNGGLLGSSSEGMGYFKNQFFRSMAEEIVRHQSLGFAESLSNTYAPDPLTSPSVKPTSHSADEGG